MTDKEKRIRELTDRLNQTAYAYYVLDEPVISDMQWDRMYDELRRLEEETGIVLEDSPTRHVGGDPLKGFQEHRHITRLWSMDKVQSLEELEGWISRTEKLAGEKNLQYYLEYKFDGLTLNLTYRDGALTEAATRGNGIVGESILAQAKTIHTVPRTIPYKGILEVQGECIMRLSTLEKYNQSAKEPLKNARNAAAGALRNLDPAVTASRHLDAFFYQVGTIEALPFHTQPEMLDFLRRNGFQVSPYLGSGRGKEELESCIRQVESIRPSLDWLIDGVVIKVGSYTLREQMGYTDKFPRWAVAFKFEAEECVTRLNSVTWELGRTGKLTPLAHVKPVDFYGVTVRKATLNNMSDILRKKIAVGCDVWIRRSNDVIPEITGRAGEPSENETAIEEPSVCPACGSDLVRRGAHVFCMNRKGCKPQTVARIAHFAGREAMDIEGLSEKTAELLYDRLNVREAADLYDLTSLELMTLEGFQEKKAFKLEDAIRRSKKCGLDAFLFALGIPNVGRKTARDLAIRFGSLEGLQAASPNELRSVPDIGDVVAQSIMEFFDFEENREMIRRLIRVGVCPENEGEKAGHAFDGLSIVVTGTLPSMSRKQAEDFIRAHGGNASGSVSRKTAFVVSGEDPGSKYTKAQALGIEIIDEKEMITRAGVGDGKEGMA